ncbi:MAG: GntR family transcriptional regulator [Fusobacteriaceae bacterium]
MYFLRNKETKKTLKTSKKLLTNSGGDCILSIVWYTMYTTAGIILNRKGLKMSEKNNSERIYEDLENKIMNLEYKPGQIITEQEICEKYGVSRTPSRDIMHKLKSTGLIQSIPFKSSYVTLLDMDIIKQSIYMRIAIEKSVIRDIMDMKDDRFLAELEYNLKLQELLLRKKFEPEEFYELDCEFHKLWFSATKNIFVWEQIEKAQIHYRRFRMLDIVEVKNFKAIYEDHKKIVEIIKECEYEQLDEIVKKHLHSGIKRLQEFIGGEFANYFYKI